MLSILQTKLFQICSCLGNLHAVEPSLQPELLNHFLHGGDAGGTRHGAREGRAGRLSGRGRQRVPLVKAAPAEAVFRASETTQSDHQRAPEQEKRRPRRRPSTMWLLNHPCSFHSLIHSVKVHWTSVVCQTLVSHWERSGEWDALWNARNNEECEPYSFSWN